MRIFRVHFYIEYDAAQVTGREHYAARWRGRLSGLWPVADTEG